MPDRIYSIQYNGRIYDVRAADNVNPNTLFAFVKQQAGGGGPQGPKEEENLLEKIPVVGGLLAGAADIPLNVVSGLANTGKSFTDVFGADNVASDTLKSISDYAESLTSAQSREDEKTAAAIRKAAEGKGIWEEVKAAARSFAVNPLDTLANVTGSAIPFAAAAASGAGLPAAAALGAASGVGTVKGSISDAVYARAREAGVPDAEAKVMAEEAQAYGGENLDQVALGGTLGAVAAATGFDKVLGRAIAKRAVEDVVEGVVEKEATRGIARRVATGAGAEAIPEATQAGQERFAQNLAEQRAGYETDLMAGVAGQAAFEGLAGGVLGGVGGIPGQSTPGPIATDEELAADLEGFEVDIEATGMPEAQDPAIRARAAEIMQIDASAAPIEAIEQAVAERDRAKAEIEPTEEPDVTEELDVGGSELAVSGVSSPDTVAAPAGPPADAGRGRVGGAGVPAGQPMGSEGVVEPALTPKPIIPPIEEISPQAQIAEQLAPTGQPAPPAAPVAEVAPIAPTPTQVVEEAAPTTPIPAQAIEEAAPAAPAAPAPTLDLNTQIDEYTSLVEADEPVPAPLVESIARQYVNAVQATGTEGLVSPDRIPAFSQFIGNESATVNAFIEQARQAAPITPAPAAPAPVMALPEAKKLVTPERITAATEMLNTTLTTPDFEGFKVTPKQINTAAQRMVRTPGLDAPSALSNVLDIKPAPQQKVPEVTGKMEQNIAAPTAPAIPDVPAAPDAPTPTPAPGLDIQLDEYVPFTPKGQPASTQGIEEAAPAPAMALPEAKKLVTPERITTATEMLNTTLATPDFEGFKATPKQINVAAQQMVRTPGLDAPSALSNVLGIEKAIGAETTFEAAAAPEQKVSEVAGTLEQNIATPTTIEELPELPAQEASPTVAETATVEKVTLPPEVQALQAEVDQLNPGFEVRFNPDKVKPYSFGIVGQKKAVGNTAYTSVGGLRKAILNETPIQPRQVIEGVPVKQMPAGAARGLEQTTPTAAEPEPKGPANAGKLTPAQEQQQGILEEIDRNRRAKLINDAQRTELVDMLRTPSPEEMDIYRRGLSDKEVAKRRALRSVWNPTVRIQNEIDKLTAEGRALRTEERLFEKQEGLTDTVKAAKAEEFKERAKDISKRTKAQSAQLVKAKAGIYKAVRDKLAQAKRKPLIQKAALKQKLAEGKISQQQYDREVRDLTPEPYMFRRAKGKATGITLEELNNAVKDTTSRWGARLEPKMVQSVADLPDTIRKEIEKLNRTDAFGFYKDGKAYLIADNMNGVEDVAPTLYHEALGHLGLRERFREGLDAVLDDIYRTNKGVAALADKFLSANQDLYSKDENPTARAVEEVLASASEAGPLRASRLDKLMKYIKDFARKYLGFDFKFSDREVRTILAMAHEQALSGEGTVMGSSSMMFKTPEQNEADAKVADADTAAQDTIEKYATTTADRVDVRNSRGIFGGIGDIITGKSIKNWLGGLMSTTASSGWIGRGGLNFMATGAVLDYADTRLPEVTARELRKAVDAAAKMNGTRAATRRLLNRTMADLKSYLLSDADPMVVGGEKRKALPVAMDYGNGTNMDMVSLMGTKSREDALKTDQIWRRYTKLLKNPDLTPAEKKEFEGALAKREAEIDGALDILSKLGVEGRKLYTRIRNTNRDMQLRRQYLMDKRIENLRDAGLSEEAVSKMAIAIRAEQERLNDRVNAPSKEDAHKDYPEVPLGLFHREYFPKRRYGNYWLRIKKTKFGEPILRFYETMAERDADWEAAAEEFGLDKENANHLQRGNDVKTQLGDDFDADNAFIKILNKISEIDVGTFTEAKKTQLRNDVYQMHLLNTPEGSGRKQFIKSKNRLGWSSDILRTFGATAEEYASDVSRLRYAPEIDRAIEAAKKSVEPVADVGEGEEGRISVSSSVKTLAGDFISNIEKRIEGDMEPQPDSLANKIVPWMNQLAFVSFLTAPATALVQVTALPMRVAPNLWGKYGMANTTRAMGRYLNVFKNLPKFESKDKGERKTFRIPTLMESNIVKSSKRHRDALTRATNEYGLIIPLSEFLMGDKRTALSGLDKNISETREKVYDAMTYLFDTSEQLTREVAFMAAYDLEYDKLADAGLSPEERQNKAVIAAKDTVNYTLGDYTNLNRPPVMKGSELARALFLFKQYSVIMTTFFVQASRSIFGPMFGGKTSRAEQVAAMKEMTGVLGMGFIMGGVVGLPLYSLGMMTLQALQDATDDDEDRKERMLKNPLTADSVEMQFRYEWLPEHFGQPMVTDAAGKSIKLSDIILNGAVSEATGWNFGSRVSLDLAGMWFRAPKDADTWTQTINNALVENIPGASASLNIVSMGEEFAKGNVLKGLEYLPAMVRAPIKAYRLSEEGVRTGTEKIKLRAEDISNAEIIGTALGFNPTQVAKVQQQNRDVLNSRNKLKDEKAELLGAYKQAVRRIQNGDADGQEKAREAVEDIMKFNKKVGNPYFGISYANMYRSLTGSEAEAKYDIQGMGLNEVEAEYVKMLGIGQ